METLPKIVSEIAQLIICIIIIGLDQANENKPAAWTFFEKVETPFTILGTMVQI